MKIELKIKAKVMERYTPESGGTISTIMQLSPPKDLQNHNEG
jgi:hypothetical protein